MTANLVIETSQSITDDLKAITALLTLPYHIRIGKKTQINIQKKNHFKIFGQFVTVCQGIHFSLFILHWQRL